MPEGEAPGIDAIPNKDKDKIAEHLHDGGHGGFELYLLPRWENFVHSLPKNPRYMFDEYLNDASKRETIAEVVQNCSIIPELLTRLADADELFIDKTLETNICIWGDENDLSASFPKPHFWYYYRIPPEHIDYWSSDIAWLEKIAEKRGISLFL